MILLTTLLINIGVIGQFLILFTARYHCPSLACRWRKQELPENDQVGQEKTIDSPIGNSITYSECRGLASRSYAERLKRL